MTDIKISADLTEAIEKLSEKLGIAADAIIPEYERQFRLNGIVWCIGGLILAVIPWFILPSSVNLEAINNSSDQYYCECVYIIARWGMCLGLAWGGGHCFFSYIENLYAAKAMAIRNLLNQIT